MASYGYPSRGYSAYNDSTPWVNNVSKTSYAPDHVCKPVVIDADGRKHPIVSFTPSNNPETRIIETQTIVMQEVHSPFVNGYKQSSPEHGYGNTGYGHVKDTPFANVHKHSSPEHGYGNTGYGHVKDTPFVSGYKHSSPEHGHGHGNTGYRPVEDKWHRSSNPDPGRDKWYKSSSPDHGRDEWNRSSSPDHGRDKWHRSSSPDHHGHPHKVEEFLTKVQTEVSSPKRFGLLSPSVWRGSPDSAGHHGHGHGNTDYGDYSDKSSKDWVKPSGHNGDDDNYYHNNAPRMEPIVTTSGGWTRPTRAGWAVPPDTSLSSPTNDINTAVGYLQKAARPTSVTTAPHSRVTVPITTGRRQDEYGQTIDSREAARRYGNLRSSPVPEERYTGTIDSREAARKYGGAAV